MQARAMALMGKKLSAAHAIEGKFSSDGLVALGGDEGIEMALAKSLAEQMDELCHAGVAEERLHYPTSRRFFIAVLTSPRARVLFVVDFNSPIGSYSFVKKR